MSKENENKTNHNKPQQPKRTGQQAFRTQSVEHVLHQELEEQTHKTNQQIGQNNEPANQIENRIVRACEATGRRRTAKTQKVQAPSAVHYLWVSDYPTLYLTQSKQRMRQPMDTYTQQHFFSRHKRRPDGFEQRQLEPKGYGGTRFLNTSVR